MRRRLDSPVMARPAPIARETKPAGGQGRGTTTFELHAMEILDNPVPKSPQAVNLRSSLGGAAASPRVSGASSPRYLQATAASAAHSGSRPGLAAKPPKLDMSLMPAAGGASNRAMSTQIEFQPGTQRTLRRSFSAPRRSAQATVANIAAPPRQHEAGNESPRYSRDPAMFADASTALPPPPVGLPDGPQVGYDPTRPASATARARRPPRAPAPGTVSTHDKSIPNARRTQRAKGTYQPAPPVTTVSALSAMEPTLLTDAGFASNPIPRKGKGVASPAVASSPYNPLADINRAPSPARRPPPPPPPPPPAAAAAIASGTGSGAGIGGRLKASGYFGCASGSETAEKSLMGGRRARGLCSPRSGASMNLLAWDAS